MKNKKLTYLLGFIVLVLWGSIIYKIIYAMKGNDDESMVNISEKAIKEPYNDFTIPKDTTHLLLNYRDPFGQIRFKDTTELPVKIKTHKGISSTPLKPAVNWTFIQYSGYIRNPVSRKLIALVSINGKSEMLSEGDTRDQVRLIKNMRDSIKISYNGQIKCISIKSATL